MKTFISAGTVGLVCLLGLSGCVDSPVQRFASPHPVGSAEQRANAHAANMRALNPSMRAADAASLAAAVTAGEEARAEAEWRQRQKADAEQEKFLKDLDAVTGKK